MARPQHQRQQGAASTRSETTADARPDLPRSLHCLCHARHSPGARLPTPLPEKAITKRQKRRLPSRGATTATHNDNRERLTCNTAPYNPHDPTAHHVSYPAPAPEGLDLPGAQTARTAIDRAAQKKTSTSTPHKSPATPMLVGHLSPVNTTLAFLKWPSFRPRGLRVPPCQSQGFRGICASPSRQPTKSRRQTAAIGVSTFRLAAGPSGCTDSISEK